MTVSNNKASKNRKIEKSMNEAKYDANIYQMPKATNRYNTRMFRGKLNVDLVLCPVVIFLMEDMTANVWLAWS